MTKHIQIIACCGGPACHRGPAHLDGAGQDVVGDDLIHKALVLQEALQVQAKLGECGVDAVVGGQEEGDACHGVRQDVCTQCTSDG